MELPGFPTVQIILPFTMDMIELIKIAIIAKVN